MYPWRCRRGTPTRPSLNGIGRIPVENLSHCLSSRSLEGTCAFPLASLLAPNWLSRHQRYRQPGYVALASAMYQHSHIYMACAMVIACSPERYGFSPYAACSRRIPQSLSTEPPIQNETLHGKRCHHDQAQQNLPRPPYQIGLAACICR